MRRHWSLFVTITPLLRSMECTCHGQVCILVLVMNLVMSVLAALVVCVGCVCVVVLGVHLVLSPLAPGVHQAPHNIYSQQIGARQAPHIVKNAVDQLVTEGWVKDTNLPWPAPIIPVLKLDKSIRLCIDYRALNSVTPQI